MGDCLGGDVGQTATEFRLLCWETAKPEVDKFCVSFSIEHYVLKFEVSENVTLIMDMLECQEYLESV